MAVYGDNKHIIIINGVKSNFYHTVWAHGYGAGFVIQRSQAKNSSALTLDGLVLGGQLLHAF